MEREKILQANRSFGLDILKKFIPAMGRHYKENRNYDLGPENSSCVSRLSPFVSHRMLLEEELVEACLKEHAPYEAEKFIDEVCWRTYWKGWLEQRPSVWDDYTSSLQELKVHQTNGRKLEEIETGRSGIDCFDFWVQELRETGYLHNHARMWFASIWIFTLQLPWQLGADFFSRHLLDGDPASNTLSWRWVAGVQTIGKHYLARSENISKYTKGRFSPEGLVTTAEPVSEEKHWPLELPVMDAAPQVGKKTALLVLEQDLSLRDMPMGPDALDLVLVLAPSNADNWNLVSKKVQSFKLAAVDGALVRCKQNFYSFNMAVQYCKSILAVASHLEENSIEQVVFYAPFVGHYRSFFKTLENALLGKVEATGIYREWDKYFFPRATSGFFRFRKSIPEGLKVFFPEAG